MKKAVYYIILLLTIVVLQINFSNAQNSSDSVQVYKFLDWTNTIKYRHTPEIDETASKYLSTIETFRDTNFLKKFITENYDSVIPWKGYPYDTISLIPYLYSFDINGDNRLDIIFQGFTGSALPYLTEIFINQGDSFKKIFTGYQCITNLNFSKNKLDSFTIYFPGCCADPVVLELHYSVSYIHNYPKFYLQNTKGFLAHTELATDTFINRKKFIIKTDSAKLRTETYIFDCKHPVYQTKGNIIASYTKGSKGIALGRKQDSFGEWLYVLMKSPVNDKNTEWYPFSLQPTEIYGWILKNETDIK